MRRFPLPDSMGALTGVAISPDGGEVAVATSVPGVARLFAVRLADGALRGIADLPVAAGVHLVLQRWATDGNLYFTRVVGLAPPELWRLPARGGPLARAAALPVPCSQGTISLSSDARSGACIVFDDRPDLWLIERR